MRALDTILFALLSSLALAATLRSPSVILGRASTEKRIIVDQRGIPVAIPTQVRRQAVLFGTGIGPLVLAGRDPKTVVTSSSRENRWFSSSTYVERAIPGTKDVSQDLDGTEGASLSFETVLKHQPDVVVTWARLAASFERLGLPVLGVAPISSAEMMLDEERLFSEIAGRRSDGDRLRAETRRVENLIHVGGDEGTKSLLALHSVGEGRWQIARLPSEVVAAAHGEDLGRRRWGAPTIGVEQLLVVDPDAIIFVGAAFGDEDEARLPRIVCAVRAIRQGDAVDAPAGLSGYMIAAVEVPLYATWLGALLHPRVGGPDVRTETRNLLHEFFGVTPTDEEIDRMYPHDIRQPACRVS